MDCEHQLLSTKKHHFLLPWSIFWSSDMAHSTENCSAVLPSTSNLSKRRSGRISTLRGLLRIVLDDRREKANAVLIGHGRIFSSKFPVWTDVALILAPWVVQSGTCWVPDPNFDALMHDRKF